MGVNNGARLADKSSDDYLKDAQKELSIADHMVYVTMPLLTDKNLFISLVDHLYKSMFYSIMGFLKNEMYYKRLFAMPREDKNIVDFFLRKYAHNLEVNKDELEMIKRMTNIGIATSKSYTQFKRSDKFVVLSQNYRVLEIDQSIIKKYLSLQKKFIVKIRENLRK
jgi:hypothetical protein